MWRRYGLHSGRINSNKLLKLWNALGLRKVKCEPHLVPVQPELAKAWVQFEKALLITLLGCFSERTRNRLRIISRIPRMEYLRESQLHSLQTLISKWVNHVSREGTTQIDLEISVTARHAFNYKSVKNKSYFFKTWRDIENNRVRKLRCTQKGALAQRTARTDQAAWRAGVQRFCGTFPCPARRQYEAGNGYDMDLVVQRQATMRRPK